MPSLTLSGKLWSFVRVRLAIALMSIGCRDDHHPLCRLDIRQDS